MKGRILIVSGLTLLLFITSSLYVTTQVAPIGVVDFPQVTKHGWPYPWLIERVFLGPSDRVYHEIAWTSLAIDSFLFLIIGIIIAFVLRREKKGSFK